jgi:hypothetical protein
MANSLISQQFQSLNSKPRSQGAAIVCCFSFSANSAPPRAVTHAATPYYGSPAPPRKSIRLSPRCTTPSMKHHPRQTTGRSQDKESHRPGRKRPAAAKGSSRGRCARPLRSRRKRRLCPGRPPAACPPDLHEEEEGRPRCMQPAKSKRPHPRQTSAMLRTRRRIQAPLIISNGSRPAFGQITPNPSISVRQTQAPAMGNMLPKMGKE